MGFGSFRWRIVLIVISILLIWQTSKVWLSLTEEKSDIKAIEAQLQENRIVTLSPKHDSAKQKVHVQVLYEALCPDSRSFFTKQLLPTYQRIPDNVELEFVPYGKATTEKTSHGYKFECQHGPPECQANIIHACSIDVIKNSSVLLEYLTCMIKNNLYPVDIMKTCAEKMNLDHNLILECSTGSKGKELLAKYGEITSSLTSKESFIPTITLDGNSENQMRILKNLLHEVCLQLKIIPEGCTM